MKLFTKLWGSNNPTGGNENADSIAEQLDHEIEDLGITDFTDEDISEEELAEEDEFGDEGTDDDMVFTETDDAEADGKPKRRTFDLTNKTPMQIIRCAIMACSHEADENGLIDLDLVHRQLTEDFGIDYTAWGFNSLVALIREFGPFAKKLQERDGHAYYHYERRTVETANLYTERIADEALARLDQAILRLTDSSETGWADNAQVALLVKDALPTGVKLSKVYQDHPDRYEVIKHFTCGDKRIPLVVRLKGEARPAVPTFGTEFLKMLDTVIAELSASSAIGWADNAKVAYRMRELLPAGTKLSTVYPDYADRYEVAKDLVIGDKKYPLLVRLTGEVAEQVKAVLPTRNEALLPLRGPIPTLKANIYIDDVQGTLLRIAELAGGRGTYWEVMTGIDEKMQLQQLFYYINLQVTRILYANLKGRDQHSQYIRTPHHLLLSTGCVTPSGSTIYLQCVVNPDMNNGKPQPWLLESIIAR